MTIKYDKQPVSVSIGKQSTVELPPRVFRLRLACMLFDVDKVFLLPGAMHDIRVLKTIYDQHPGLQVLVTGHCDTQAPTDYNQYLSDERAESITAFLMDQVDVWMKHYVGTAHSKTWGTKEDQFMLKTLPEGQEPYYSGDVDGIAGPQTQDAVKKFQTAKGLTVDGFAGPDTRKALVGDYMALDGTTLPAGTTILQHGCGEYHLAVPTADEVDEQKNRRVEVFFFEGPITPPPRNPCNDCPEYQQWCDATHQTINLCEDAGWLDVLVMDAGGTPVKQAKVFAEGAITFVDVTNDQGYLRFPAVPPGPYDCRVVVDGVDPCKFPVTVTAGSPPAAPPSVPSDPPTTAPLPTDEATGEQASDRSNLVAQQDQQAKQSLVGNSGAPPPPPPPSGSSGAVGSQVGVNQALVIVWKAWEIILVEQPDDIDDLAREGKGTGAAKPWDENKNHASIVYTKKPDQPVPYGPVFVRPHPTLAPKGQTFLIGLTHPDLVNNVSIRRAKPHHAPIIWQMDTTDPIKSTDTSPVTRKLIGRARFSLWAGADFITDANLKKNIVDDVSLLVTVQNGDKSMAIDWDIGLIKAKGSAAIPSFLTKCVASAHKAGIQILAGFALVDRGEDRIRMFDKWLDDQTGGKNGTGGPTPEALADSIVDFIDKNVSGDKFDGISFDIESFGLIKGSVLAGSQSQTKIDAMRGVMKRFYKQVATRLAPDNRICAVTVGGMMSDDAAILPLKSVPNVNPQAALAAKVHVYDLAKESPNIVIRPMAYDNAGGAGPSSLIPQFNSDPAQLEWHEAIVKFALDKKKLHPGQFQLGMKVFQPKDDDGNLIGQGGNVTVASGQNQRATLLRKYRCGLILFAMGKSESWDRNKNLNDILNKKIDGSGPLDTNVEGQPMQVPLDADGAKKLKKT